MHPCYVFSLGRRVPASHQQRPIKAKPLNRTNVQRRRLKRRANRTLVTVPVHAASLAIKSKHPMHPAFCLDTGAPRSVIGLSEARKLANSVRKRLRLQTSRRRFRFADATFDSLGLLSLPLATPPGIPTIFVTLDVISAEIPALLGLDILDCHSMYIDTVQNLLVKCTVLKSDNSKSHILKDWNVPVHRHNGHVYADMSTPVITFFNRQQLVKLHRQFCHPSADKLYRLLKRGRPNDTTPETLKILEDISKRCDPCQRIQPAPTRFRVTLGAEDVKFNEEILMDIMYIDNRPILHIVDASTHFSAARFLPNVSVKTIWSVLVDCWFCIYTGLPNRILVDQGTSFGESFVQLARASDVQVNKTGIEAHSSLSICERYHQPLRNTFRKIKLENPNASPELILSLSVHAMNNTLGPEGLVPVALVFGEYPSTRVLGEPPAQRLSLESRAKLAEAARNEMQYQMAKLRINRALRHQSPAAAHIAFEPGQNVLVWRENIIANRIGEWKGPYAVSTIDRQRKLIYVRDCHIGPARPFGIAQVKPYHTPEDNVNTMFTQLHDSLQSYRTPDIMQHVYMTETLSPDDDRCNSPQMTEAKRNEIRNLIERGTFKVVCREDVPLDANVLTGRFVLCIKSTPDGNIKHKARFVIGGHRDKLKNLMVHTTQTLQPSSIRLLLTTAAMFNFDIWTSDVKQAYLQAAEPLSREVYIKRAVPEFELSPHECLQLLRPLYGLCESGDLWFETLTNHHRDKLGMASARSDAALFSKMKDNKLIGLSGVYVDDMLRVGTAEFKKLCRETSKEFDMSEDDCPSCNFTGFKISYGDDNTVEISQKDYCEKLKLLPDDAAYSTLCSVRMQLAWLSHTRPDALYEISQLTQITRDRFDDKRRDIIKRVNRLIKYVKENNVTIKFPSLDDDTLKIIGFSDASFASNHDCTSHLGYIIFIGDSSDHVVPVHFRSYKARRVTRSVMGAELISFSDMFDTAFTLSQELKQLLPGRNVPVNLFTDSKSLFDVISKGSRTSERRLMIDIASAREGFKNRDISDIGFVRSGHNIADGLTKSMNQSSLMLCLRSSKLNVNPEQWIMRSGRSSP